MHRRTFIAAAPCAAVATAAGSWDRVAAAQSLVAARESALPGFQAEGSIRFERPDVHAGDRPFGASFASRSAAYGCSGAAGTAHPLATLAAIETLKRGGSAADAAIAANVCLGFLEPVSAGLGGDCFAFVWDPAINKLVSLAGSGRSPKTLTLQTVRARAKNNAIPALGAVSVSTPGALDAWWTLHQRYGRLQWAQLFEPAIELCTRGVPVPQIISAYIGRNLQIFLRPGSGVEETANAMHTYAPSGQAPGEGEVFRNPDLAHTYKLIADGGRQVFYEGPIARTIDAYFKRIGGWLSYEDLRAQHAEWLEPLVTQYRGVDVYAMAANTQGLATLQMLNILENFDLRAMGFQSPASIHIQAEAKRLA
jgi:gamma-glutamyltranspeptidase / glutathione hydrolase